MFVVLTLPHETQGEIRAYDEGGAPVKVAKLCWVPKFLTPSATEPVAFITVCKGKVDKPGDVLSRTTLAVSGRTGRIRAEDHTQPVVPICEGEGVWVASEEETATPEGEVATQEGSDRKRQRSQGK